MKHAKTIDNHARIRVTVIMKRDDGKICFVRHLKDQKRYWLLPGGGQDFLEKAEFTAARELQEELKISCESYRLLFIRESISKVDQRHIQFLVFEGINPDFSKIQVGEDKRVEGYDFFGADEIINKTIYPAMKDDISEFAQGKTPVLFKSLEWI